MDLIQVEGIDRALQSAMRGAGITPRTVAYTRLEGKPEVVSFMMAGNVDGLGLIFSVRTFSFLGRPKLVFKVNGQMNCNASAQEIIRLPGGKFTVVAHSGYFQAELDDDFSMPKGFPTAQIKRGLDWFGAFLGSGNVDSHFWDLDSISFMPLIDWSSEGRKDMERKFGEETATYVMCALALKSFPRTMFTEGQQKKIAKFTALAEADN